MFRLPVSCLTFHKGGAKAQKVPEDPNISLGGLLDTNQTVRVGTNRDM